MITTNDKLNSIYQTKLRIKNVIQTESDEFSEYPDLIAAAISPSGGGVSYSYLNEKLTYYVEKDELYNSSYATQSYVVDYVNTYAPTPELSAYVTKNELSAQSYATTSDLSNYLLSPTISGYEGQMKLYNDGFFEVTSSGAIRAKSFTYNQLNSWSAYTIINKNSLRNYVEGRIANIESTYATQTYVADLYADNIHNFIWTGTSAEYAALPDYTTYQIYMIKEG